MQIHNPKIFRKWEYNQIACSGFVHRHLSEMNLNYTEKYTMTIFIGKRICCRIIKNDSNLCGAWNGS